MLRLFLLLAIFCSQVASKAFGHTVEYRFEYDPKKSDRPIIEWRYDDLLGRRASSHDRHSQHVQPDIRKAPRKYYSRSEDETIDEIPHRASFPKWINERISRGDNRRIENEEMVDEMAAELRRQSEAIIASHFPNFPFSFHRPQPSYNQYYSGY